MTLFPTILYFIHSTQGTLSPLLCQQARCSALRSSLTCPSAWNSVHSKWWSVLYINLVSLQFPVNQTLNYGLLWTNLNALKKGKANHSSILAWRIPWTIVHGVANSWTQLSGFHFLSFEVVIHKFPKAADWFHRHLAWDSHCSGPVCTHV